MEAETIATHPPALEGLTHSGLQHYNTTWHTHLLTDRPTPLPALATGTEASRSLHYSRGLGGIKVPTIIISEIKEDGGF